MASRSPYGEEMKSRRWAVIVTIALGLAACGGADDADVVLSVEPASTTTIDLADGAFIKNDGVTLDGNGVPVTTVTVDPADDTGASTTLATTTLPSDASVATDTGSGEDNGSTGDASGGATTGGTATSGGGAGTTLGPASGLIVINGVSYPFETTVCDISDGSIEISGGGIASDNAGFAVDIFFDGADIDGDGTADTVLEISVLVDVPAGADGDSVPEFSVFDITTSSSGDDSVLTFEVTGSGISGSGTIDDLNGVAFPADSPAPMTFAVRCS